MLVVNSYEMVYMNLCYMADQSTRNEWSLTTVAIKQFICLTSLFGTSLLVRRSSLTLSG